MDTMEKIMTVALGSLIEAQIHKKKNFSNLTGNMKAVSSASSMQDIEDTHWQMLDDTSKRLSSVLDGAEC